MHDNDSPSERKVLQHEELRRRECALGVSDFVEPPLHRMVVQVAADGKRHAVIETGGEVDHRGGQRQGLALLVINEEAYGRAAVVAGVRHAIHHGV